MTIIAYYTWFNTLTNELVVELIHDYEFYKTSKQEQDEIDEQKSLLKKP